MSSKRNARVLTEEDIDKIVIAQAEDDSAWGKPIKVHKQRQRLSSQCEILPAAQDNRRGKVKRQKRGGT